ncbi:MAG: hypothetical protein BMS9Abin25_1282 [Gammaproteobacteria bacterium]|nr:MAG: hypothetical protein BMS9Abin25_1282 [Gammaproteobacteria bacterium]
MNEKILINDSSELAETKSVIKWTNLFVILLFLSVFAFHLSNLPDKGAILLSDSFRYIWEIEFSRYFFSASSVFVRALNYLLGNNLFYIAIAQLAIGFLAPLFIYLALKRDNYVYNLFLGLLLAILYISAGPLRFHDVVSSESIFTSLFITFTAILFSYYGKRRNLLLLLTGIPFIFSRNPAPYIILVQLILFSFFAFPRTFRRTSLASLVILSALSLFALWQIQYYDTTKEINVADNLFSRIFPYPEKVEFFKLNYGMPDGPFIELCQKSGSNVNDPCLDHEAFYTGDSLTRQYRLTNDEYGLADWIRKDGMHAWTNFILFQDTRDTVETFTDSYQRLSQNMFNNKRHINQYDVFPLLANLFSKMGFFNFTGIVIYLFIGMFTYFFAGRDETLKLGLAYMLSSFPAFFIGLFGDSEEITRYTYPAILSLYIGILIYILAYGRLISVFISAKRSRE